MDWGFRWLGAIHRRICTLILWAWGAETFRYRRPRKRMGRRRWHIEHQSQSNPTIWKWIWFWCLIFVHIGWGTLKLLDTGRVSCSLPAGSHGHVYSGKVNKGCRLMRRRRGEDKIMNHRAGFDQDQCSKRSTKREIMKSKSIVCILRTSE